MRVSFVGEIIAFNLRSFSTNLYAVVHNVFTRKPQKEVLFRVSSLQGVNIGAYDDFTNLAVYEDEYLCSGKCRVTKITPGKITIVDAKAI